MKKILEKNIKDALSKVIHPEINYSLLELGMIKNITLDKRNVSLTLLLPFLEIPIKEDLINLIKDSIRNLDKNIEIQIKTAKMGEGEKERFMRFAQQGWKMG